LNFFGFLEDGEEEHASKLILRKIKIFILCANIFCNIKITKIYNSKIELSLTMCLNPLLIKNVKALV